MSRPPSMICDLNVSDNVWKISIHVVDLWIVKERNGQQHVECLIQDSKGDKIHVVTRNRDFEMWNQTLQEHQTYMVYNCDPTMNDLAFKICDNPLKVFFHGGTTITMLDMPEIPMHNFDFKPIVNFLHRDFHVNRLYDVIGVLHQVMKTQVTRGGRKWKRT
ncbi:hypothetical protein KIW84_063393 [Lathyrus oleraceus]|uniref:Replication protein A 70 kDa DNA-binding subunit B/D first OB fold domain-containing protein n=1 Tax=Pisum sativum TaxID=3888 RepID=A0A9D4W8U8_PEA|nr:hypothetical protein KIW84_063393 [Pisum sativum]